MNASTRTARTAVRTIVTITAPAASLGRRLLPRLGAGAAQLARHPLHRVPMGVGHPLLERDDRVVGDVDVLGAELGAALGDVAVAEPALVTEQIAAVQDVLGVHLQARHPHEEARPEEARAQVVGAVDVADVLAEEALDAAAGLVAAVDVHLPDPPRGAIVGGGGG